MKRIAIPVQTDECCAYGCGLTAKYKNGSGRLMCSDRSSKCPAVKKKNSVGVKDAHSKGLIPTTFGNKRDWRKGKFEADFTYNGRGSHKYVLIHERGHRCERCMLSDWLGSPITLELEHKDGDNKNNNKDNLELLCPNCHSQTTTWCGRNINKNKKYVTDEEIIDALKKTPNIRQALLSLGLTAKALNYQRCYDLKYGGMAELVVAPGLSPDASA